MAGLRENQPDCVFYRSSLKYGRPRLADGWFSPQTAPLVRGPHVLILFGRSQFALTKALDCVQTACTRFARPAFGGVAREPAGLRVLPLFSKVRQTQAGRRLVLALFPQGDEDQHRDGYQVRQHLEQLDVLAPQIRNDEVGPEQEAEEIGTPDGVDAAPGGKDNQCHSQPAQRLDRKSVV